jgi:predicted nucleic acid-binding protein
LVTDFVDSLLVYLMSDDPKRVRAREVMRQRPDTGIQALNEMVNAMRRKLQATLEEQVNASMIVRDYCRNIHPLTTDDHIRALGLVARYKLSWWDSLLVATALRAGAKRFFSEDSHDGLIVADQMTIINPFRE